MERAPQVTQEAEMKKPKRPPSLGRLDRPQSLLKAREAHRQFFRFWRTSGNAAERAIIATEPMKRWRRIGAELLRLKNMPLIFAAIEQERGVEGALDHWARWNFRYRQALEATKVGISLEADARRARRQRGETGAISPAEEDSTKQRQLLQDAFDEAEQAKVLVAAAADVVRTARTALIENWAPTEAERAFMLRLADVIEAHPDLTFGPNYFARIRDRPMVSLDGRGKHGGHLAYVIRTAAEFVPESMRDRYSHIAKVVERTTTPTEDLRVLVRSTLFRGKT